MTICWDISQKVFLNATFMCWLDETKSIKTFVSYESCFVEQSTDNCWKMCLVHKYICYVHTYFWICKIFVQNTVISKSDCWKYLIWHIVQNIKLHKYTTKKRRKLSKKYEIGQVLCILSCIWDSCKLFAYDDKRGLGPNHLLIWWKMWQISIII